MIKVGDKVKIVKKPSAQELSDWANVWNSGMDYYIGTTVEVIRIDHQGFILHGIPYQWPIESLRLAPKVIILNFSKYKWIARDHNGGAYLYNQEPVIDGNNWDGGGSYLDLEEIHCNIPNLGKDWKDSLHKISPDGTLTHVPRTHTITIDGKDITISKESFNNLKEQLTCT